MELGGMERVINDSPDLIRVTGPNYNGNGHYVTIIALPKAPSRLQVRRTCEGRLSTEKPVTTLLDKQKAPEVTFRLPPEAQVIHISAE